MIILSCYHIFHKGKICYARGDVPPLCPICGGRLKVRDSRRRRVILTDGQIQVFLLRRLKCQSCGILHQEMPDLFLPYKHYSREVIESALSGNLSCCPAENSTIYRWARAGIDRKR